MLEFFPIPLLIGIIVMVIVQEILWRRNVSYSYLFFFSLFWIYLLFVIGLILFPMPIPDHFWLVSIQQTLRILSSINLIPFDYGQFRHLDPWFLYVREIYQNILLTIPFGFGICVITPILRKNIIWLGLAVGVCTETAQLVMCLVLGSLYRGIDINDTIMNALGVYLGYLLFLLFSWLYMNVIRHFKIKPTGIFAYLHTQAARSQPDNIRDNPREARSS